MAQRRDLRLAQLACSRLCHDLAGVAGAIANGIELATEGGAKKGDAGADAEALALVGQSARQVNARIAFFRAAFGANPPAQALADAALLVEGYLSGGPVRLEPLAGPAVKTRVSAEGARLALVLTMVGAGCLPRGGTIRIEAAELPEGVGVGLAAVGKGAAAKPEMLEALAGRLDPESASPRDIHAIWAGYLAAALGGAVEVAAEEGGVRLGVILPRDKVVG